MAAINAESEQEARHLFAALSAGGEISMPFDNAFWGTLYGMFTDKFGIRWMVNHEHSHV